MSNPNYTLEIISHHPTFKNKSLRKYYVDGIETIGAWGDEPFEIRFKNNTWQKVQVKLSLDGTDILTGDKATTDISDDMWVVNGYGTLSLKAWPETNNGGAHFVFTSANNSVAVHTHGDLSCRGIIAAAVYTEGHVEPVRLTPPVVIDHHHHHYPQPYIHPITPIWYGGVYGSGDVSFNTTYGSNTLGGGTRSCSTTDSISASADSGVANNYLSMDMERSRPSKNLESLVSVGAGQHVDQQITYVAGLIKPLLAETVRVRYLWWDDLVAKLKENNVPAPHASGFPGDRKQKIMSLGGTPRIGEFNKPAFPRETVAPSYLRV